MTTREDTIDSVVQVLREEVVRFQEPAVTVVARKRDPFRVLISCLLSLRTKDEVTAEASRRLFALADTPETLVTLSEEEIERAIFPVGFYKTKAKTVKAISQELLDRYDGRVPDEIDELLMFKGVGRKTANLVVTLGFNKPGICVDTHVHRISNRLGWVRTRRPEETEMALRDLLPQGYWIEINDFLVTYGQNVCTPISPRCSTCRIAPFCQKVGVEKSR
jgi:endonuclease-3